MEALLITLLSVVGGGFLSLLGAILLGQLVPGSRVTERDAIITRMQDAAMKREEAYTTLKDIVDRQAMISEVTKAVLEATHTTAARQTGGTTP